MLDAGENFHFDDEMTPLQHARALVELARHNAERQELVDQRVIGTGTRLGRHGIVVPGEVVQRQKAQPLVAPDGTVFVRGGVHGSRGLGGQDRL